MNAVSILHVILLIFSLLGSAFADTGALEVRGIVVDAHTGVALEGANISSGSSGTRSDIGGRFVLRVTAGDSLLISHVGYEPQRLLAQTAELAVRLQLDLLETREVVVVGGLRAEALAEVAASVTVVDSRQMRAMGGNHLQDLLHAVPNLNWAGGTSRPRYLQIRGIGERSQYAGEGAPNFSVGFVVDDVDLSGLGTGLLFDIEQLEVFKGPQSSAFGPNAMAGLVHMQSTAPSSVAQRRINLSLGGDGLLRLGGTVNAPLSERLALRFGYQWGHSDGFRDNVFLDKSDSNARRESMLRLKMRYAAANGLLLLGTAFRAEADNGYDVWTPNNNETLETYTDNPGDDHQTTNAFSLRAELPLEKWRAQLVSISTYSQTDLDYSFDGDWGNDEFWKAAPYGFDAEVEGWRYDFFNRTLRTRTSFSQELRLHKEALPGGGGGIAGVYFKRLEEKDNAVGYLFGGDADSLRGTFDMGGLAVYGQYERSLVTDSLRLVLTLRADRSTIDYDGVTNGGAESVVFAVDQWLPGGRAALNWRLGAGRNAYAAVARGYRAGGVNQHPFLVAANRPYDPEYMLNFEVGYRVFAPHYRMELSVFHGLRSEQQVNLSSQQNPGDPNSFFFFVANAAGGRNSGAELEGHYRLNRDWRLFGSLAYLNTHVDSYLFETAAGETQVLGHRAAAHAPEYSLRLGSEYNARSGLFARGEWSFMDAFYFSDSHDQVSDSYQLFNGSLGYRRGAWGLTLWGRNLLDERYAVRGFFFGLEPPNYPDTLYLSYGDPRQLGLSLEVDL